MRFILLVIVMAMTVGCATLNKDNNSDKDRICLEPGNYHFTNIAYDPKIPSINSCPKDVITWGDKWGATVKIPPGSDILLCGNVHIGEEHRKIPEKAVADNIYMSFKNRLTMITMPERLVGVLILRMRLGGHQCFSFYRIEGRKAK